MCGGIWGRKTDAFGISEATELSVRLFLAPLEPLDAVLLAAI
jgi:hypothetical protein